MRLRLGHVLCAAILVAPLALGCSSKKKRVAPPITQAATTLLDQARAREVPSPVMARFSIKVRSKPLGLGGTTGGGLQVIRPGRGRIEIYGPLGGSLVSLISDGEAFSVFLPRDQRHLFAPDAEALVREATRGAVGLDDVLGLLVGDVPFGSADLRDVSILQDQTAVRATFVGPNDVAVALDLDPLTLTPSRLVARDAAGAELLGVVYEGWLPLQEHLLPARVELTVPAVDLYIQLRYSTWKPAEDLLDLSTAPPQGVVSEPLVEVIRRSVQALNEGAVEP